MSFLGPFYWTSEPTTEAGAVRRPLQFSSLEEKASYLDGAASLDARHPKVRELAARIAHARGPNDQRGIATDIHRFVQNSVGYVYGPSFQELADSATILDRGFDNCAG